MLLDLSSAEAKLARADEHAEALISEVDARGESDADQIVCHRNDDATQVTFQLDRVVPIPEERWALLLGDALFNYRCALDHLVYAIAIAEADADPPPGDSALMFPIAWTDYHLSKVGRRLNVMGPGLRAFVERSQPQGRGDHPLVILKALHDEADKHRLIHFVSLAVMGPQKVTGSKNPGAGGGPSHVKLWVASGAVDDGAVVAQVTYDRPSPDMEVDADFTIAVAVKTPLMTVAVGHALTEISTEVRRLLDEGASAL